MDKNPWQTLSSAIQYQNPWIKVTEHQVVSPGGQPGIYGTVHFKNQAVGVIPYEAGEIWMVGQYRYPLDSYSWEIPEGGGPAGEDPVETAKRELQEETGLTAGRIEPFLEMHLSNSVSDEWGIVYLARDLVMGQAEPEHTEELKLERMSLERVVAEVEAGRITDSLTVAAIYKMAWWHAQGKL